MCWLHRKYARELTEAHEQLAEAKKQGHRVREFTSWLSRQLEDNHFAERFLLSIEAATAPPPRRRRGHR